MQKLAQKSLKSVRVKKIAPAIMNVFLRRTGDDGGDDVVLRSTRRKLNTNNAPPLAATFP